jgi:hypothetical protein
MSMLDQDAARRIVASLSNPEWARGPRAVTVAGVTYRSAYATVEADALHCPGCDADDGPSCEKIAYTVRGGCYEHGVPLIWIKQ